ncbi:MAG TPA: lipase maturation factor family protein [Verrucomicrobiae bacterium]|nr:lipase maturation factor family protein [Verrucomicrobiae bacterium]
MSTEHVPTSSYWLTRYCFQRLLGAVYLIAFLIAANQYIPLLGEHGLLPVRLFLQRATFWEAPSMFWVDHSDSFITAMIWCGLVLSLVAVTGISERWSIWLSVAVWALLWLIDLSLVNVGQVFYGFGWETLLLESGFLAIFLGSSNTKPPRIVLWLLLWVLFRVIFGAGMIKMRGDICWRDLTCLYYHYETQPLPNPLSWYLYHLPHWWQRSCVAFTLFAELIAPWFLFAPWRKIRAAAGLIQIYLQFSLILSGNLSWLNYVTIALCIPCFDDAMLAKVFRIYHPEPTYSPLAHRIAVYVLLAVVAVLSIRPTLNLISPEQAMNASFEPLHLVNTYGAFGSITRERYEIIIEGTDSDSPTDDTPWREYEFKGKPGNPRRRPCIVSPYHWKLDWQMWFAAMSDYRDNPWILNLVAKLLQNDKPVLGLLANNPFPDKPPTFVRAELYLYHFTDSHADGAWWKREHVGHYLPPLSLQNESFRELLRQEGWRE